MNSHEIAKLTTKAIEELSGALEAGHSEALTQYLAAIGRFHKYSLHNVMLLVLQKPDATHVAGFHTWHELGRHVRKGERASPSLRRWFGGNESRKAKRWRVQIRPWSATAPAPV